MLAEQGAIQEAGYEEQAKSYDVMSRAARGAAAGEQYVAYQTQSLAQQTRDAGSQQATGDFAGAAMKGVAAVGSLVMA